jgi:8-oxo-dGTP pyrophosphatase MutT (NUDIX family)
MPERVVGRVGKLIALTPMAIPPPNPASTIVLVRKGLKRASPSILLLQRKADASWLGGAWVFPGGRVDDGDRDQQWRELADGIPALRAAWPDADPGWLVDHAIAAVRELFEETGLILVRPDPELRVRPGSPKAIEARAKLRQGLVSFLRICRVYGWRPAVDRLLPLSRWITPEQERKRFDTVFFVAEAPDADGDGSADGVEIEDARWAPASAVLERYAAGEVELAPPTLRTLEDLSAFKSVARVLAWASASPRLTLAPRLHVEAAQRILLLPGDALYPVEAHLRIGGATRFVEREGRWHSEVTRT